MSFKIIQKVECKTHKICKVLFVDRGRVSRKFINKLLSFILTTWVEVSGFLLVLSLEREERKVKSTITILRVYFKESRGRCENQ